MTSKSQWTLIVISVLAGGIVLGVLVCGGGLFVLLVMASRAYIPPGDASAQAKPAGRPESDVKYIVGAVPSSGGNEDSAKLAGQRASPFVFGTFIRPTSATPGDKFHGKPSWAVAGKSLDSREFLVILVEDRGEFVAVAGRIDGKTVFENHRWAGANDPK